jgi:FKBP-type peptidyl-prolyl cis-trans isomerase
VNKDLCRLTILLGFILLPFVGGCQQQEKTKRKVTQKDLIEANRNLVGQDARKIKEWIAEKNLPFKETNTGLWYLIDKEGKGNTAQKGQVISLKYKLMLLDGTLCYSSDKSGLKRFLIGQGGVESGLEDAVLMLKKGSKARFILPPHLAHGLVGDNDKVPARATVLYELEVVELKK